MDADLKLSKLRNDCSIDRSKIAAVESKIISIEAGPNKNRASRKRLSRLKLELQRLRARLENHIQLLENSEDNVNMTAASRGLRRMAMKLL